MYQDIWVKGQMVKKGQRECEDRYNHIKHELLKYNSNKTFTVLDIGANSGYFSFRIAEDFNAEVTMIESNKEIKKIEKQNQRNNVKLINQKVTVEELKHIIQTEQFDVILALSILHHFEDYDELINIIFENSELIFIEASALEEAEGGYNSSRVKGIMNNLELRKPEILTYTNNLRNLGARPLMKFSQSPNDKG
ncbi:class I SAM-dependent methyltransferase [Aquibacillus koreensis]|uniref:Class I SAM-dependent methyltransferase n=1 Tax=Aquibacillus koreensis TaxID=279446 RepID=A0A9X3WKG6_9BACI|nr:class I SAM-dependent methyltransferase [Aquibacillus koreensis]MCT2536294.1 class I SAM-dependent methyltransferase [Aquibacillus koreensis]MDC3421355.1 class I SAM-dependent methyltransferase [Aquibacillus koreensis]